MNTHNNRHAIFRNITRNSMTMNLPRDYAKGTKIGEYIEKYNVSYVLNDFSDNNDKKQSWTPLIDANMYNKALEEFLKYGYFLHFPTKYIYSWIDIIMRNTAVLLANTVLYGRGNYKPVEEAKDFLMRYPKHRIALYFRDNWNIYHSILDKLGLYNWMKLADNTIGLSDLGIKALIDILSKYNDNTSTEDAFVMVNKCLNVVHMRGDLSSIFIEGGKKTLDKWK